MPTQLKLDQPPRPVHPFPARMAPEIAREAICNLQPGSVVVDPMCGSGVVLREAVQQGHEATGYDVDPLAVLMSKVWTEAIDSSSLTKRGDALLKDAAKLTDGEVYLPWIDEDAETTNFINFWFADTQKKQLRKLAFLIACKRGPVNRALQLAVSRLIITKKVGASLAWDVSHSRPHRVKIANDYDVLAGFRSAYSWIAVETLKVPTSSSAEVHIGDARKLTGIAKEHADVVITSPPYMNAIDYIRGHRLSLVWLGYSVSELRRIRSSSVGREKRMSEQRLHDVGLDDSVLTTSLDDLTQSHLRRYAFDMYRTIAEISRILKPCGRLVLVVARSQIRGQTIDNPGVMNIICSSLGLRLLNSSERDIPTNKRYLPPPTSTDQESLQKRMRTESVMTFEKQVS